MSYKWTDSGKDFVEESVVGNGFTEVFNTISVGNGNRSPNDSDTALDNQLYQEDTTSSNVSIDRGSGTGEIRATVQITGGTEVPSNSEIVEFGFETDADTFIYREVRDSAITVASGETKIIEIRAFVEDAIVEDQRVITDVGKDFVANRIIGDTTDQIQYVAVGESTGNVSPSNTTLDGEIYRGNKDDSNVEVQSTSNVGDINVEITITAGTESSDDVNAGAEISEFGIITGDGVLLFHEKRDAVVTVENNDTKTFKIPLTIV